VLRSASAFPVSKTCSCVQAERLSVCMGGHLR
jgi:hypothetical protein